MKKAMNILTKVFVVMMVMCSWMLGCVMMYLIIVEGIHFTLDFTTVEDAVDTLGQMMLCVIPLLGMIATVTKLASWQEKERKEVQSFEQMSKNAQIG